MFAGGSGSTLAELVIYGRLRIGKVAAPEGRLFEAFHRSSIEQSMPAHNVGAGWVEFAAFRRAEIETPQPPTGPCPRPFVPAPLEVVSVRPKHCAIVNRQHHVEIVEYSNDLWPRG
jgi:hypothetical protein